MTPPLYRLIGPRGGYWRAGGHGYTTEVSEAGLFDKEYALEAVTSTHGDVRIELVSPKPVEEGSSILASNLEDALNDAVQLGAARGDYGSAYVHGLKSNLAYLRKHGTLTIKPS